MFGGSVEKGPLGIVCRFHLWNTCNSVLGDNDHGNDDDGSDDGDDGSDDDDDGGDDDDEIHTSIKELLSRVDAMEFVLVVRRLPFKY